MHTNQTFNSLTIDNKNLPFPVDVKEAIKDLDWTGVIWNTIGLPAFDCAFTLTGDQLYFESNKDGTVKLKQSDFTGSVMSSGVINLPESEVVYLVTFELFFCQGRFIDANLASFKTEGRASYETGLKKFTAKMEKEARVRKSKWFRFLYKPYFYIISIPVSLLVWLIQVVVQIFLWLVGLLLPYKL